MSLKNDIGLIVIGLAEYYEKVLTDTQLAMYVEDLMNVPAQELLQAVRLYRNDSKNDKFPLPAKLRAMIQLPDDQRARDAVSRILRAVSRIGNYRTSDAQEFIGELGWEVVKAQGGWVEVCRSITDENKGTIMAQWRELAVSFINKNRLGLMDEKPTLEFKSKQKTAGLESLGSMVQLKKMERK